MSDWVDAEFEHRQYLQRFVCSPHPYRRLKKLLRHGLTAGTEIWSSRVQSLVRDLEPRLLNPWVLTLRWDDSRKLVEAVGCYRTAWNPSGIHDVNVYLLATHRDMWGRGHGQATLDRIWDEVGLASLEQTVTVKVVMKADVHNQNARCKKLLVKNGWSFLEDNPDGVHEVWAVVAD